MTPAAKVTKMKPKVRRMASDSDMSGSDSDKNDVVEGTQETMYDSENENNRSDNSVTPKRQKVLDFLQSATPEELQHIPACGMKKVNAIIAARPFTGWLQTVGSPRFISRRSPRLFFEERSIVYSTDQEIEEY